MPTTSSGFEEIAGVATGRLRPILNQLRNLVEAQLTLNAQMDGITMAHHECLVHQDKQACTEQKRLLANHATTEQEYRAIQRKLQEQIQGL